MSQLTEDEVRDKVGAMIGLTRKIENVRSGVGQITTFNQLGFKGVQYKPDGWYLPSNTNKIALILETKSSTTVLKQIHDKELIQNCNVVLSKYGKCIGVLTNGTDVHLWIDGEISIDPNGVQDIDYYLHLLDSHPIDKQHIYAVVTRINNLLHHQIRIKSLKHRMIFTACALVAQRYGLRLENYKRTGYSALKAAITGMLNTSLEDDIRQNSKIRILIEQFNLIEADSDQNQITVDAIDLFIDCVLDISSSIESSEWHGEDVMGIFFNEFNRYKTKTDEGQVFTPDHITSLMYRLLDVNYNDRVLDATCGSGAFLTKAMANMIHECGGENTQKAREIKRNQLYGIENDSVIFALACANMLIHKDGKTNITKLDTRSEEAMEWIRNEPLRPSNGGKPITKVLMNPPYETKNGCMDIVENVLNSVPNNTLCAFILPDNKLEKSKPITKRILQNHRLDAVIKLPTDLFFKISITTSIFIFTTGIKNSKADVFGMWIEDDGLMTVKNQGRHDVKNKWGALEDYWVEAYHKKSDPEHNTVQWFKPGFGKNERLSYLVPFEVKLSDEDFAETAVNYIMFKNNIEPDEFKDKLFSSVMYRGMNNE